MKKDGVKIQRTVSSLQKENCSLKPEETLQQEPVEEEVLKIAVEEAAASVQETVTGFSLYISMKQSKHTVHKTSRNC